MTDQTIKDLFYGNLNLFDRPMHSSNEYNEALHEAGVAREVLEEEVRNIYGCHGIDNIVGDCWQGNLALYDSVLALETHSKDLA